MQLLGISTHQSWIDHPAYGRDPYRHVTQYVNQSGWSSQVTSGEQLPASHFGGMMKLGGTKKSCYSTLQRSKKHQSG